MFQSAPRSRDRGDALTASPHRSLCWFQSAPRSRDRGDFSQFHNRHQLSGVSIRAPVSRPGRAVVAGAGVQSSIVSIRAPVSRPGRRRRLGRTSESGFNPRPGLATGATRRRGWVCASVSVSIRAPVSRPGRHIRVYSQQTSPMFQSAPRSRDRGDQLKPMLGSWPTAFQSAPRSRDRGD